MNLPVFEGNVTLTWNPNRDPIFSDAKTVKIVDGDNVYIGKIGERKITENPDGETSTADYKITDIRKVEGWGGRVAET